jgi:hypothetical protein
MKIITAKLCKDGITGEVGSVSVMDDIGVSRGIPFNTENTDYQVYLKWIAEGNQPTPADEVQS